MTKIDTEKLLDDKHWNCATHRQRMTTKEWKHILLDKRDYIIFCGRIVPLKAKNLGVGVVEVYKDLEEVTDGE